MRILIFLAAVLTIGMSVLCGSCAQIGFPAGGTKDTLAPVLTRATPAAFSKNVTGNRFLFEFDEYIDVQEIANNLFISPAQSRIPTVIVNTRSISLRFRDSLRPNTTYNINFGNAIRDINENNILRDFSYVFSTGSTIDSLKLQGNVVNAETGSFDSTLLMLLYRDRSDSAVLKRKPDFVARVNGSGDFQFNNLPSGSFALYALKDRDGSKTYNSKTELFGFAETSVSPALQPAPLQLYVYGEEKPSGETAPVPQPKKLGFTSSVSGSNDFQKPLTLNFTAKLFRFDPDGIRLTDTLYQTIAAAPSGLDSTKRIVSIPVPKIADQEYRLIIQKDAVADSLGNSLGRSDTLEFRNKRNEDYGRLVLHFKGLDLKAKPVLLFMNGETIAFSSPVTAADWQNNFVLPGEYGIRVLFDTDGDGKWTPGDFRLKRQPEVTVQLPQKLSVRADWDNERDILF